MISSIRAETYRQIYAMLDAVTPVDIDCGTLCGAACCEISHGEVETGMYLLPGEEKLHDRWSSRFTWSAEPVEEGPWPDSWSGRVWFVQCRGPAMCDRALRPIQCRTYPLLPHLTADGRLVLVYNDHFDRYTCPLIEGRTPLRADFMQATHRAWETLMEDRHIRDMIQADSAYRGRDVSVVWPV